MRTTIILMFSLFLSTVSLFGQKEKFNYIDSDTKGEILKTEPYNPYLKKPDINLIRRFDSPILRNLDRFRLYQDASTVNYDTVKCTSDIVEAEKFPGASRFYAKNPNLLSSPYEKSFILHPDTSIKSYLIIIDPIPHTCWKKR
jgi:hypothetical protein